MQSATLVSNCHDIQLIIYLLYISVPARWLTVFLQSWCLDLCFLCTQSLGPCCPSSTSCYDLRWPLQDPDCPPEPRFHRHNPFNITTSCHSSKINSIRNKNVIIHWMCRARDVCWIRHKFNKASPYRTNTFDVTRPQAYMKVRGPVCIVRNGIFHVSAVCSSCWCWIKHF